MPRVDCNLQLYCVYGLYIGVQSSVMYTNTGFSGSTINTEPKQIVTINLAGELKGGRGAVIQARVSCSYTVCQP